MSSSTSPGPTGRTGRRGPRASGEAGVATREAILREARRAFAEGGYSGTSLRSVAQAAGVDVSLVSYYFGSKEHLFTAVMELPASPREVVATALEAPLDQLGEALTRGVLSAWADAASRQAAQGVLQSLSSREDFATTIVEYAGEHVIGPLAQALGTADGSYRASLAMTQLIGLALARHVAGSAPLASILEEHLIQDVAPVIQGYLTGSLASTHDQKRADMNTDTTERATTRPL